MPFINILNNLHFFHDQNKCLDQTSKIVEINEQVPENEKFQFFSSINHIINKIKLFLVRADNNQKKFFDNIEKQIFVLKYKNNETEKTLRKIQKFIKNDAVIFAKFQECFEKTKGILLPPPSNNNFKSVSNPLVEEWRLQGHRALDLEAITTRFYDFLKKNPEFADLFNQKYKAKYKQKTENEAAFLEKCNSLVVSQSHKYNEKLLLSDKQFVRRKYQKVTYCDQNQRENFSTIRLETIYFNNQIAITSLFDVKILSYQTVLTKLLLQNLQQRNRITYSYTSLKNEQININDKSFKIVVIWTQILKFLNFLSEKFNKYYFEKVKVVYLIRKNDKTVQVFQQLKIFIELENKLIHLFNKFTKC